MKIFEYPEQKEEALKYLTDSSLWNISSKEDDRGTRHDCSIEVVFTSGTELIKKRLVRSVTKLGEKPIDFTNRSVCERIVIGFEIDLEHLYKEYKFKNFGIEDNVKAS